MPSVLRHRTLKNVWSCLTYRSSTYRRGKCQNSRSRLFPACTTKERSAELVMRNVNKINTVGFMYFYWSIIIYNLCVILWPVQCSLHPGCGGGSAGGCPAAAGRSAGTSGSWAVCGPSSQERSPLTWIQSSAVLQTHTHTHTEKDVKYLTRFYVHFTRSLGPENHSGHTNLAGMWHQHGDMQTVAADTAAHS